MSGLAATQLIATGEGLIPLGTLSGAVSVGPHQALELTFSDGAVLLCLGDQRLLGIDGRMVRVRDLAIGDRVVRTSQHVPRTEAGMTLPKQAVATAERSRLPLPSDWSQELGHYLGWLVGDGCFRPGAVTIYGSSTEIEELLPRHRSSIERWTGFRPKPSVQQNGTRQLRVMKKDFVDYLLAVGVAQVKSGGKVVPSAILRAPHPALVAFLRGLFDADGCVVSDARKGTHYVGLGSKSLPLVRAVQSLLISLGITSRIYRTSKGGGTCFSYTRKNGERVAYTSAGPSFDLRITGRSLRQYAAIVGFDLNVKRHKLRHVVEGHSFYNVKEETALVAIEPSRHPQVGLALPTGWTGLVDGFVCEAVRLPEHPRGAS